MSPRPVERESYSLAHILHVFCTVHNILQEQFSRFDEAGTLSCPVLRELVGDIGNKGALWWLKDHAHNILRNPVSSPVSARLLDWGIGYIFHETVKLAEAAHQRLYYMPRLRSLKADVTMPSARETINIFLTDFTKDTGAVMARGIRRMRLLLVKSRLVIRYAYAGQTGNISLAREINDHEAMVRRTFGDEYETFLNAVYEGKPWRMRALAALSLLEGGRPERAVEAAKQGTAEAGGDVEAAAILARVLRDTRSLASGKTE